MQKSISIAFQCFIAIMQIKFIFAKPSDCRTINSTVGQIYFNEYEYVQSNTQDFSNISNIGYNLIEKVCVDKYKIEGQVIQSIFILNLSNTPFVICHLLKNSSYFISCTSLPFPLCKGNFQKLMEVEILLDQSEICQNIYHSLQKFYVFCKNTFKFSIKIIDGETNKSQVSNLQYDEIVDLSSCSQEIIQLNDFSIILAIIDCENWRFYKIINQTITIILDQSFITENIYPQQIQFCQRNLYLTKLINQQTNRLEQFYYLILFDQDYQIQQIQKTQLRKEIEIFKIIFTNLCQIQYIVFQYQHEVKNIFNSTSKEVFISSQFQNSKAYAVNDLFLIQSQSSLLIIKNEFQNQTFQFNNSSMNFLNIFNSFYQFDLKQEYIIFYQFQKQKLLKLETKYFFVLQTNGLFELNQIICYEIHRSEFKVQQNSNDSTIQIQVLNNCQQSGDTKIYDFKVSTLNNFTFPITSENKYFSINDRTNLSEQCLKKLPVLFSNQSYKILSSTYQKDQYYLIQNQDRIQIYMCDSDKFQAQLNIQDYQVYYYQNIILLIQNDSLIQLYNLVNNQFLKMDEINQGKILHFQQIDYNFIIKYQEKQYFINLNSFQLQPKILSYYNIILQDQEILFFYEISKYFYILQYQKYFIIQQDGQLFYQDLSDQIIIFVAKIKQVCFIVTVSNSENLLSLYQFNKFELSIVVNKSITDYEFIRPLKYKFKQERIAIQATQQSQQFIIVLSVQNKDCIELIRITKCQNCDFWLNQNSIYLIDQQQNIYCFYLNILILTYKLPESLNTYVTSKISEKFINQFGISTNFQIDLILINQCFDLKPIQKEIFLPINSSISFNLEDFFYGPIDAFKFHSNQLKFDFYDQQVKKQKIDHCSKISLIPICILEINFYYEFENKTIDISVNYIYINKLKNEVVILNNQHKLDKFNPYFLFKNKDDYFFLLIISDKAIIFEFKIDVEFLSNQQIRYYELFDQAKNFDIERIGDFIILKTLSLNQQNIIYLFFESKFYFQEHIQFPLQIIQINNLQTKYNNYGEQYISITQQRFCCYQSDFYFQINFYEILNFQLQLNQSLKIFYKDLLKECQHLPILDYCFLLSSYHIIFLKGTLTIQTLDIYWLMTEYYFSILIKASLELSNTQKIKLQMQLIRHPMPISSAQVIMLNQILCLKTSTSFYLYNLRQTKKLLFYDYFSNLQTPIIQFIQYNSTHLLLIFQEILPVQSMLVFQNVNNQFIIDENNFSQDNRNFSFTLIASYGVQESNISITIQKTLDKQKDNFRIIFYNLLFQFLCLLIIILFIRKKNSQNLKLTKKISVQNQEKI